MPSQVATKEREVSESLPAIEDAPQMPRVRRGRTSMDLSVFEKLIQDFQPHVIKGVEDESARNRWGSRLRKVASDLNLEVETTYVPNDQALYFKGWPVGEAPPRGRRDKESRISNDGQRPGTKKVTTASRGSRKTAS